MWGRRLCGQVMDQLSTPNGALEHKTLEAPVQLAQMAANMELDEHEIKSVWTRERDDALVRRRILVHFSYLFSTFFAIGSQTEEKCRQ